MINQRRTTDMLSLWIRWNTAPLQWWSQVFQIWMGHYQPGDVIALWQQWNTENVQLWSQMLKDWTGIEAYAPLQGQKPGNYQALTRSTQPSTGPLQARPLTPDPVGIAKILADLEQKVERLSAKIEQLTDEAAKASAIVGPTRPPDA